MNSPVWVVSGRFRCKCGATWDYNYRLFIEFAPNEHRRYAFWPEWARQHDPPPEHIEVTYRGNW